MLGRTKYFLFLLPFALLFFPSLAQARTDYYEEYNVDFYIHEDSSVDIEEEIVIFYDGEYHGTHRYIDLIDAEALAQCQSNENLQCGGFDFMTLNEVWSEENGVLSEGSDYELILNELYDGSKQLDIRYEFSSEGRTFNTETFTWGIKYTAFGSIGYFDDYDLFYWDTVIADRTVNINNAEIRIHLPEAVKLNALKDIKTFIPYDLKVQENGKLIILSPKSVLLPGEPFTVLLKLPKGLIDEPASVEINSNLMGFDIPFISSFVDYKFREKEIISNTNILKGIPTGKQTIEISSLIFSTPPIELDLESGEHKSVDVTLSFNILGYIALAILFICNLVGFLAIFLGIFLPFYRWQTTGRDIGGKKTIAPWFSPPDNISPSLLGSIKDEKVDVTDITSTIIDAAYKGFLKIKEEDKSKEYSFIKLKDFEGFIEEEKLILETIFSYGSVDSETNNLIVKTTDLKNKFYLKIPDIQNKIYDRMVADGYFAKRPDQVRGTNFGIGFCSVIAASTICIIITSFTAGIGIIFIALPVAGLLLYGIGKLIFANFMPAKTPKGTLLLEHILGFRMYLHTAERFRMQNLTPEMFEKYLSYAIVFGIEEEWAEKFKDIYKGNPEWYEGSHTGDYWTPHLLARSLNSMTHAASSVVSSKPQSSSSSWGGSSWSGGGGFSGGFSGGGGGGGGGGSW